MSMATITDSIGWEQPAWHPKVVGGTWETRPRDLSTRMALGRRLLTGGVRVPGLV